jgi:hypothetical protein
MMQKALASYRIIGRCRAARGGREKFVAKNFNVTRGISFRECGERNRGRVETYNGA